MLPEKFASSPARQVLFGSFAGGLTSVGGGNFWSGFASGALASVAGSMWHGGEVDLSGGGCGKYGLNMGKHLSGAGSTVIFGTLAGAGGAVLTGGNVWQGAATGAIVAGLNHVAHGTGEDYDQEEPKKIADPQSPEEQAKYSQDIKNLNDTFGPIIKGMIELRTIIEGGAATRSASVGLKLLPRSKVVVQFGKVENQVNHAFRHIEKMGLTRDQVKSAILKDVPKIAKNVNLGGKTVYRQIRIGNQDIIYSAHRLENGVINVGRIHGITK